jgi:hypothetical protein
MVDSRPHNRLSPGDPKGILTMGSPLQNAHGRLAAGAVIGAVTAALFAAGVLGGEANRGPSPADRAAVEPVPPGQQARTSTTRVPESAGEPTASSSATRTTTTTTTTGTTTTTRQPDAPVITTTTEAPPPATTTNRPPTTTTTRCTTLICVG